MNLKGTISSSSKQSSRKDSPTVRPRSMDARALSSPTLLVRHLPSPTSPSRRRARLLLLLSVQLAAKLSPARHLLSLVPPQSPPRAPLTLHGPYYGRARWTWKFFDLVRPLLSLLGQSTWGSPTKRSSDLLLLQLQPLLHKRAATHRWSLPELRPLPMSFLLSFLQRSRLPRALLLPDLHLHPSATNPLSQLLPQASVWVNRRTVSTTHPRLPQVVRLHLLFLLSCLLLWWSTRVLPHTDRPSLHSSTTRTLSRLLPRTSAWVTRRTVSTTHPRLHQVVRLLLLL